MAFRITTYYGGDTALHRLDARVKILLLLAYSIGLFFVHTWWGMGAFVLMALVAWIAARLPVRLMLKLSLPVIVLACFSLLFNALASPNIEGILTGCFFAVRMIVLVVASFIVCLTTSSSAQLEAFRWMMTPFGKLGMPVDDAAFTLALALRFIPVIEREFQTVRAAQISRGAETAGSFARKLSIWAAAFSAVFVGLFRHADALASAMDARCYGATPKRTALPKESAYKRP